MIVYVYPEIVFGEKFSTHHEEIKEILADKAYVFRAAKKECNASILFEIMMNQEDKKNQKCLCNE